MPERSPLAAGRVTGKDAVLWLLIVLLAAALHWPVLCGRQVYFTNDLVHINHPWRVMTAQQLQQGRLPSWNPYSYFGLPLSGMMQTGQFQTPSLIFHLFSFEEALGWFLLLNYALGGLWAYLWLRRWRFGRWSCLAGAGAFALGGYALAYLQFPNLLATVLHLPGFFLFWNRRRLLALLTASAFYAGYPVFWAASILALFCLRGLWSMGNDPRRQFARSAGGILLGAVLSAPVLLPGLELSRVSNRQAGVPRSERLGDSMSALDFTAFIHPELTRKLEKGPTPLPERLTIHWTLNGVPKTLSYIPGAPDPVKDRAGIKYTPPKSCYVGVVASLLMLAGFILTARRRLRSAAALVGLGAAAAAVLAGTHWGVSVWLWEHFTPLLFVRGPARFAFLPLAGMLPLIAAGLDRIPRRARAALAAAVLVELAWTGRGYYPTMPRGYFRQTGEFVEYLKKNLGEARYFLYPRSDIWAYLDLDDPSEDYQRFKALVYDTYKQKLFGVSNAVFELRAATGDYESLFPQASGAVIRFLRDAPPERLADYLKWAGVGLWFNRDKLKGSALVYDGEHLWQSYRQPRPVSQAYWLPQTMRPALEKPFAEAPPTMKEAAWELNMPRQDRFVVEGEAKEGGILYLALPNYPGWQAYVNGGRTALHNALGAFMYCDVPSGTVKATLVYRPTTWTAGLFLLLAALCAFIVEGMRFLDGEGIL